ncbi:Putative SKP1/BTB/POZ domain superfamily protein [Septoria linicola]|uniref:SKP1/BTB/POZ domain superfamily protein n=1 Tax=Septoria linicola TaxID=215465 RepID=A0A9Q9B4U6_9PEZI|nr:putative SKP1/BTB/POZ domain superfamily protein [Septoria linicola]USW57387.1 Putative SKP1/BTB/POZ domain superfamily protein [Septoria linicola]
MSHSVAGNGAEDELFLSLKKGRLITVFIGSEPEPIYMQQSLLCGAADYFTNLLTNDTFEEAKTGVVRFPEDDLGAWKILLAWILKREVPQVGGCQPLVNLCKAWYLGDKYIMRSFQDQVMWSIYILPFFSAGEDVDSSYCQLFQATLLDTPPRKCVAEAFAEATVLDGGLQWNSVPRTTSNPEYAVAILSAIASLKNDAIESLDFDDGDSQGEPVWLRYMVGKGPRYVVNPWYRNVQDTMWLKH